MNVKTGFYRSLHFKVASGVIATILVLATADSIVEYFLYRNRVIEEAKASGQELGRITLQGLLEVAMFGEHPKLLQSAMERLVAEQLSFERNVEEVSLLNLDGEVRFSSNSALLGRRFSREGPECLECHQTSEKDLPTSVFVRHSGSEILRIAVPVPNRSQCQTCHRPEQKLNGILLLDLSMNDRWAQIGRNFQSILMKTGLTVLAILAVLGILMNRLVILPIKKLTQATARFGLRPEDAVPAPVGSDEIGQLGLAFRQMASDLKVSIEELKKQRGYLHNLMNSLDDGLIVIDLDLTVELLNTAATRQWGEKIPIGASLRGTVLSPVTSSVDEAVRTAEVVSTEIELEERGESVFFDVAASPVWDPRGKVARVILLTRNVSARKALEQQVRRAERLASVGQLAAGVAHEINNPMAAIMTCAEGLERYLQDRDALSVEDRTEVTEYLGTIGEAASRCKDITQRLLSLSIEPEKTEFQSVDLAAVLREVLTLVDHQARQREIQVERALNPVGEVLGDPKRLYQMALNLLLNSLEAVDEGGKVKVVLSRSDDHVLLEISDNGAGIREEHLDRLFDPFFTTKIEGRGTGLGLAITESIVRQHQGKISVDSRLGEGTRLTVILPGMEGR